MEVLATAALLLGLSCANVANLLLARGTRRTRDMACNPPSAPSVERQARRAHRRALVYCAGRHTRGVILAAPLSASSVMSLVPVPLRNAARLGSVSFDWHVALFASTATAVTAVISGLVPARRLANTNPIDALRQQGRGSTGPRPLMQSLVIGEVALASVLLMALGLMADNLSRLSAANLGLRAGEICPPLRWSARIAL